jgi:quinol monooxygenase YgiN
MTTWGRIDVSDDVNGEVEIVVVTMQFDAVDDAGLLGVLSKYVVLARMEPGCRNVDLISSVTHERRHLVIEKWESPDSQRRHFDSAMMVEMASACSGLLSRPPQIDLWEATSAHDLR